MLRDNHGSIGGDCMIPIGGLNPGDGKELYGVGSSCGIWREPNRITPFSAANMNI